MNDTIEIMKKIADSILKDIVSTTDCTATIGVGINKFLAKVATSKLKPNGSHIGADFRELLMSLKLRDLPGIGHRAELKLTSDGLICLQHVHFKK
jgi:nucleotidyltransferase/DNA polymerase involved in DNA repair